MADCCVAIVAIELLCAGLMVIIDQCSCCWWIVGLFAVVGDGCWSFEQIQILQKILTKNDTNLIGQKEVLLVLQALCMALQYIV